MPVTGQTPGGRSRARTAAQQGGGGGYATGLYVTCCSGQSPAASRSAATSVSSVVRFRRSFVPTYSAMYRQCTSDAGGGRRAGS